jgi:hypothetical protein
MAFIAAAPGNTRRAAFFPPRPGPIYIAKTTILSTTFMLLRPMLRVTRPIVIAAVPRWLPDASRYLDRALAMSSSPLVPLAIVALGVWLALAAPAAASAVPVGAAWRALAVIPLIAFLLVASAIVVGPYGTSAPPPPRALIMPQFVLECLALAWGVAAGLVARTVLEARGISLTQALMPVGVIVAALLALQSARSTSRTLARAPVLEAWARAWDEGDRELRAAAREGRMVGSAPRLDPVGGVGSIGPVTSAWVNNCAAQYYGLDSVTGR